MTIGSIIGRSLMLLVLVASTLTVLMSLLQGHAWPIALLIGWVIIVGLMWIIAFLIGWVIDRVIRLILGRPIIVDLHR
jgi:hypothetical protein